jgi:hypothetical protein
MGTREEEVLTFAAALEMIHAYSLVHDDLPGLDNDSLRRGRMTTHIMHGEGMAILAGDALLNLAYELMTAEIIKTGDFKRLRAAELIRKCAGARGMLNGQAKDIDENAQSYFLEHIVNLYRNKTADLFRASLVSGAMIAGADRSELEALSSFSDLLGIYFQIQDDLLDEPKTPDEESIDTDFSESFDADGDYSDISFSALTRNADTRGASGSVFDIAGEPSAAAPKQKVTFVSMVGEEEARKPLVEYELYIREAVAPYGDRAKELIGVFEFIKGRVV